MVVKLILLQMKIDNQDSGDSLENYTNVMNNLVIHSNHISINS